MASNKNKASMPAGTDNMDATSATDPGEAVRSDAAGPTHGRDTARKPTAESLFNRLRARLEQISAAGDLAPLPEKAARTDARLLRRLRDLEGQAATTNWTAAATQLIAETGLRDPNYAGIISEFSPEAAAAIERERRAEQEALHKRALEAELALLLTRRRHDDRKEFEQSQRRRLKEVADRAEERRELEMNPTPPAKARFHLTLRRAENSIESDEVFTPAERQTRQALPPEIERRFLQSGDKFYLLRNPERVQFQDKGSRLVTQLDSPGVIAAMVRIAETRGWDEIKVTGTDAFRRAAWLEATAHGMHVRGYEPSKTDLATLARHQRDAHATTTDNGGYGRDFQTGSAEARERQSRRGAVQLGQDGKGASTEAQRELPQTAGSPRRTARRATQPGDTQAAATQARTDQVGDGAGRPQPTAKAQSGSAGEAVEVLVAHGPAPYLHNPQKSSSYFVTTANAKGEQKTWWGVGLADAIGESKASPGDAISVKLLGQREVTVEVPVRDASGKVTGTEIKDVMRNDWRVQVAEAFRREPKDQALVKHPELASAYAAMDAIGSRIDAERLNPAQRALISERVRANLIRDIERQEIAAPGRDWKSPLASDSTHPNPGAARPANARSSHPPRSREIEP